MLAYPRTGISLKTDRIVLLISAEKTGPPVEWPVTPIFFCQFKPKTVFKFLAGVTGPPVERPVTPCFFGQLKPKTVLKFLAGVTGPPVERPGTPCFYLGIERQNGINIASDNVEKSFSGFS